MAVCKKCGGKTKAQKEGSYCERCGPQYTVPAHYATEPDAPKPKGKPEQMTLF